MTLHGQWLLISTGKAPVNSTHCCLEISSLALGVKWSMFRGSLMNSLFSLPSLKEVTVLSSLKMKGILIFAIQCLEEAYSFSSSTLYLMFLE